MVRVAAQAAFTIIGAVGAFGFFLGFWGPFEGPGWMLYIGLLGMWATGALPTNNRHH